MAIASGSQEDQAMIATRASRAYCWRGRLPIVSFILASMASHAQCLLDIVLVLVSLPPFQTRQCQARGQNPPFLVVRGSPHRQELHIQGEFGVANIMSEIIFLTSIVDMSRLRLRLRTMVLEGANPRLKLPIPFSHCGP